MKNNNRKKIPGYAAGAIMAIMLGSFALSVAGHSQPGPMNIDSETLHGLLQTNRNFQLVDVRQPWEFEQGHIKSAELIPLQEILDSNFHLNRDDNIVLYCRTGHRSTIAANKLIAMGYKNIENLSGGIIKWPYGLVKGKPQTAEKVTK